MKSKKKLIIIISAAAAALCVAVALICVFTIKSCATKKDYNMGDVVFADKTVVYDGQEHSIEATNLPLGVTVTYEGNGKVNVGTYTVTAHFTGDVKNYNEIPDMTATLTIDKATYNMSGVVFADLPVTYDGQAHTIVATNLPQGVTATYEGGDKINAGTYTVTAHFTGDSANYNPIPDKIATLTINKATYNMSGVVFADLPITYDGQAHTIVATNLPQGVTATYEGGDKINAGTYTVTAHFTGDSANYNPIPDKTATLTINKATYNMSGVVFADLPVTYDGEEHSILATNLPAGVQVTYEGNGKTDAGTYTVTAHFTGDSANYNSIPDKTATLTINKATYNMSGVVFADLPVTYDGNAHSIFATNLPAGVQVTYEGNGKIKANTYTVTAHFTGDSKNYNSIPDKTATLIINKRELGVQFEGEQTIKYDRQEHKEVTATLTNLVGSDNVALTLTYSGDMIEAGEYTVTATIGDNENYTLTKDNTYKVTITRAEHTVTFKQNGKDDVSITVLDLDSIEEDDVPNVPEREHYTFNYWTIQGSSEKVDFPYTVTEDIVFVAQFTVDKYEIIYHLKYEEYGATQGDNPEEYEYGTALTLVPAEFSEMVFYGWYTDPEFGSEINEIKAGTSDTIDLYAKWGGTKGLKYSSSGDRVTGYEGTDTVIIIPIEENGVPVTSIDGNVFQNNPEMKEELTSITIGRNITSIGENMFNGCAKLVTVYWNAPNCDLSGSIFTNCPALSEIVIGDSVQNIPARAFEDITSLTSIKIGNGVTSIGMNAFAGCTGLKSVTIGEHVNEIGNYAFNGCTSLKEVYWNAIDCPSRSAIFTGSSALTTVIIGENVKTIPPRAFENCTGLLSIKIPDGVTTIGMQAFKGCISLKSVTVGNGVISIGASAFSGCSELESVILGSSVTTIGGSAFLNCAKLSVYYCGSAEQWAEKNINVSNVGLTEDKLYYYSAEKPSEIGNFWRYVDGKIAIWGEDE